MIFTRARLAFFVVLAGILAGAALPAAQAPAPRQDASAASVASYGLSELMPVDPEAAVGTLPNGLRYYVRANGKPARRAELRLVVKAGSVLEDDDQQGAGAFRRAPGVRGHAPFSRDTASSISCRRSG